MITKIKGGKVFNSNTISFESKDVCFNDRIVEDSNATKVIDANGKYVIPGFIDVHTHGRCGYDIMETNSSEFEALTLEYGKSGVTTLFPTVMTAPIEKIKESIKNILNANSKINIEGIHVEGPYIDSSKKGCHDEAFIRDLDTAEMKEIINSTAGLKVHFTVAPEHDNNGVIRELVNSGASIGIGHTSAKTATVKKALDDGAVSFTHTFNAMPALNHREPGPIGVALSEDVYAEFIVDGFHISSDVIKIAYNAKKMHKNKFVLITDSIPATGLENGNYEMNGIPFTLENDKARTKEGTIVGSVLSMPKAVMNLMSFCNISLEEAIICGTTNPAKMMGIYDKTGSIEVGKRADIIICDKDLNIEKVIANGNIVYEK